MEGRMTAYFDQAHEDLRGARGMGYGAMVERFDAVETRVVHDCTVAAMFPEFPPDLREAIHRVVLRYGIQTLPVNAPPADFDTPDEHKRRLDCLVGDLHSVFHELGGRLRPDPDWEGQYFTDNPLRFVLRMYARGEEEREQMVASDPATAEHSAAYMARMRQAMDEP